MNRCVGGVEQGDSGWIYEPNKNSINHHVIIYSTIWLILFDRWSSVMMFKSCVPAIKRGNGKEHVKISIGFPSYEPPFIKDFPVPCFMTLEDSIAIIIGTPHGVSIPGAFLELHYP